MATRLATSGTLTRRSRAMSIRNGARVVPLAAAVNIASDAAASNAQGSRPGRDRRAATRSGALIGRSVVMRCLYSSDPDRWPVIGSIHGWRAGGSVLVSAHGEDKIRIGCGAGFADDRIPPGVEIVERGDLDYLAMECLAERTIARETLDRAKDPAKGYTPVLLERMEAIMPPALQRGVKIVTNMGAANPDGCCAHPAQTCIRLGLSGLCVRRRAGR